MNEQIGSLAEFQNRFLELQHQVRRLRWTGRLLGLGFAILLIGLVSQQRRVFITESLYATELNIPVQFLTSPEAGIAPALDRKSISFWVTSAVFNPRAQVRIDVATSGTAALVFYDHRRPRIKLGLDAQGEPSLQLFDASGKVSWSASSVGVPTPSRGD